MLGIDESGRGPVIGPMVIAGVQINKKDLPKLRSLGVRDSKLLSPNRREYLAKEIRKIAKNIKIIKISAQRIDSLRTIKSLNKIELDFFAQIINSIDDKEVYLDLPEAGKKWTLALKNKINPKTKLVAEHKADVKYKIVGASSIIAKTTRDNEIRKIEKQIGITIGSGYPSDPITVDFLENYFKEHKEFPDFVRKSWITAQRFTERKNQKGLSDY